MKKLRVLLGVLTILFVLQMADGHAQPANALLKNKYVVKNWNNRSGLPQNTAFDIERDKEGFLWIATNEGLVRFDGIDFTSFNQENTPGLYSNTFNDLYRSANQTLWAASWNTILLLNKNILKTYDLRKHVGQSWISQIAEDNEGNLWIGTLNGDLFCLRKNTIVTVPQWKHAGTLSIQSMQAVSDGLLIGTNKGLYAVKSFGAPITAVAEFKNADIRAICAGRDKTVWIGTKENGLFHLIPGRTIHFGEKEGLEEPFIYSLAVAPNGDLWVGTSSSGLQVYSGGKFTSVPDGGYSLDGIRKILFTEHNLVWLGTPASGLIQLKPANVSMYSGLPLTGNIILPIYQHTNGDVWVGTAGKGLNRISAGRVYHYTSRQGLSNGVVLSLFGTNEHLYIGTASGLNRLNFSTKKIDRVYTQKDGLASNTIQSGFLDSEKRLWIVTRAGGVHFLKNDRIIRLKVPQQMAQAELTGIFEDRGKNIWIGSTGAGILKISANGNQQYYHIDKGPSSNIVYDFYEDKNGAMWMATEAGIVCFDKNRFHLFDRTAGLKFNAIYRIIDDAVNSLWLSGNFGLQSIALADLEKLKSGRKEQLPVATKLFDRDDGMSNSETNGNVFPAGCRMADGTLWFPTIAGIAIVNPKEVHANAEPPNIHLGQLEFGNEKRTTFDNVVIPPFVSSLSISYAAVNFTQPQTVSYYYRLLGFDNEWKNARDRRVAYYTNLGPGDYVFEVRAEQFGAWSPTRRLNFSIKPFFYQTTWFKTFLIIFLIASGFLVHRFYSSLRQKVKLKMLVEQKTNELLSQELGFKKTLDELLEGIQIIGFDWHTRYANNTLLNHARLTREEIFGKPITEVFPGIELSNIYAMYQRCMHKRVADHMEAKFVYPEGERGWFSIIVHPIPEGIFILTIDVSERKKAEERLKLVLKAGKIAWWELNMKDDTVVRNQFYDEIFGYNEPRPEWNTKTFYEHVLPEDRATVKQSIEKAIINEKFETEFRIVWPDGSIRWLAARGKIINVGHNDQTLRGVLMDITEIKTAQENLEQYAEELKKSNKELERFAYVASHDLQEPLRMVSSFLTLLENELAGQLSESGRQYIDFAVDGADRMKKLILDLLQYSRVGTNKDDFEPINLNDVLGYVTSILQENINEKHAEVILQDLPVISANKTLIHQLFLNLFNNALKFQNGRAPRVEVGCVEEPRQWLFYVKDNGIGIDEKYFDQVFVIFQRLHSKSEYGGTGIGLAICKKIVDVHRGKIWIESEVHKGSTFYFTIPKTMV